MLPSRRPGEREQISRAEADRTERALARRFGQGHEIKGLDQTREVRLRRPPARGARALNEVRAGHAVWGEASERIGDTAVPAPAASNKDPAFHAEACAPLPRPKGERRHLGQRETRRHPRIGLPELVIEATAYVAPQRGNKVLLIRGVDDHFAANRDVTGQGAEEFLALDGLDSRREGAQGRRRVRRHGRSRPAAAGVCLLEQLIIDAVPGALRAGCRYSQPRPPPPPSRRGVARAPSPERAPPPPSQPLRRPPEARAQIRGLVAQRAPVCIGPALEFTAVVPHPALRTLHRRRVRLQNLLAARAEDWPVGTGEGLDHREPLAREEGTAPTEEQLVAVLEDSDAGKQREAIHTGRLRTDEEPGLGVPLPAQQQR